MFIRCFLTKTDLAMSLPYPELGALVDESFLRLLASLAVSVRTRFGRLLDRR